ncbi:TetR/AcrR family transcriptional regulator [Phenylobacterium sp.]|uniref:TetR/AcrR family transcriptional regulator n=1 Tax=Phenylobacterium sp. TaxID=1871053 RepID=UPI003BAB6E6B
MWIEQQRPRPRATLTAQPRRAVRAVRRSSKGDATRRRILDAAMAVVADEGYHAATHQRIAQAAGLVRTAINYHFPDQDSLADALVDHLHRLKAERVAAVIGGSLDDHPTLAIEAYWALLQETPFVAIAELECCARTDAALRGRLAIAKERRPPPALEDDGLYGVSLRLLEGMARGGTQHDGAHRLLDLLKRAVLAPDGLLSAA